MSVGDMCCSALRSMLPLLALAVSDSPRPFDSRDGHVYEIKCKVAIADVEHSAQKGDALGFMNENDI